MERGIKNFFIFNDDWQCCGVVNDLIDWFLKDNGFRVFGSVEEVNKAYKSYCDYFSEYPEDGPPFDLDWKNVSH